MGKLSKTYLFGLIPVDGLLHFAIGLILTLVLRKKGLSPIMTVTLIALIQLLKEFLDSFSMTATFEEALKDTVITLIFPVLNLILFYVKRTIEKS